MKNFKVITVIALTLLCIFGTVNVVSAKGVFRINNETRYSMSRIYVCPYGESFSHQQNSHVVPSGKTFTLGNMPISSSNRYWNIKIVLSNGKSREWKKQNLYSHREMTIYDSGSKIFADFD